MSKTLAAAITAATISTFGVVALSAADAAALNTPGQAGYVSQQGAAVLAGAGEIAPRPNSGGTGFEKTRNAISQNIKG